jgi:acetyl-CoA carboxylase beta subunit
MERSLPYGDGVVTGFGEIDGRQVAVFSQDFSIFGGSLGEAFAEKVAKLMDLAERYGCPVIGINDSAGARIQEGVEGLAGYGEVFYRNVRLSGVVPQISIIAGPCAGGAVYSPAMTDVVMMVEGTSQMFITGPDVIKTVTGEEVTHEQLGGADTHARVTGVAHLVAADEDDVADQLRRLLSFLPSNNLDDPPAYDPVDDPARESPGLDALVPEESTKPYDMHEVLTAVLDDGDFFELQAAHAANILVGFGRLDGRPVGVVANQPRVLAGTLDIDASVKAARFVRMCDAFNIPLVIVEDVPGFLPGTEQEFRGIIRTARSCSTPSARRPSQGDRHHREGLRRRLRRHELQGDRGRLQRRMADRRDRRHGLGGRRRPDLPARDRRRRRPRGDPGGADRGLPAPLRQPLPSRLARLRRRRDRAPADPALAHPRPRHRPDEAGRPAAAKAWQYPAVSAPRLQISRSPRRRRSPPSWPPSTCDPATASRCTVDARAERVAVDVAGQGGGRDPLDQRRTTAPLEGTTTMSSERRRARDLGITIGRLPTGPRNAITDVAGVAVGHETIVSGDGPLVVGQGRSGRRDGRPSRTATAASTATPSTPATTSSTATAR